MVEWSEAYCVGHPIIDGQHRKLFAMCHQAEQLLARSAHDANDQLHSLLNDLGEYVRVHFDYEETLLRQSDYPNLHEHIAEHDRYWKQLTEAQNKASMGVDVRENLVGLLKQWLIHHILEIDMQYRSCIVEQG